MDLIVVCIVRKSPDMIFIDLYNTRVSQLYVI